MNVLTLLPQSQMHLFAMNCHIYRRINADTHVITVNAKHGKADKVARAKAVDNGAQPGMRATKISGDPQPGNVRRMKERRLLSVPVKKHGQEFRFTNGEGLPVGAKPYEEGVTKVDHPKLSDRDWEKHADAVKEGYPKGIMEEWKKRRLGRCHSV